MAADFQKEAGQYLINMISQEDLRRGEVLDVGIGSGAVTKLLAQRLKKDVFGCDIALGMVLFCKANVKDIIILQADAEDLPFKEGTFEMVFSNIAYQWVQDFKKAFIEVRRVLKKGGRFYFSILVKDSLKELYETLASFFNNGTFPDFPDFLSTAEYIKSNLEDAGFHIIRNEEVIFKRYYRTCFDLLRSIKMVGAGKIADSNIFGMGKRSLFFEMVKRYDEKFCDGNGVFATYKVIFGCVEK